jgi:HD-GYP domain-containing protein (c-di-GMP phosphodiesterase class II)/DNA-binding CsgD family transcriptional regulator
VHAEGVFRLLGLFAGLAGITDLGTGGAADESLRRCVVATRLAHAVGCPDATVRDVMAVSLLEHIGCTAYAWETAAVWGDDVAVTRAMVRSDGASSADAVRSVLPAIASATGRTRGDVAATMVRTLPRMARRAPVATCEVASEAGSALGLSPAAVESLGHVTAMWNGRGFQRVGAEDIPLPARMMHVAAVAVMFHDSGGPGGAADQLRRRRRGELDPRLTDVALGDLPALVEGLDTADPLDLVLDLEPDPVARIDADRRLDVARVCGDLVDLKSPWLHGHSTAVGDLAGAAATALGLDDAGDVRVAGYLHDVGRIGMPGRIWDCPRPWTAAERDQVRLHPYHSERALLRVPELTGVGYHRGRRSDQLSMAARVLAAADDYRTSVEPRRHRPGLPAAQAASRLESEVRAGRLDPDAVAAVLAAAGCGGPRRRTGAAGLTPRQVDVLRLVSRGLSNREVARRLGLSPRTVDRHVADLYERIGTSSRAAAALFAMEHGLVGPSGSDEPG